MCHKNFLEATQLENKINDLEKNRIHIDSLQKDEINNDFIKNNKSILKIQQRFKSETYVFTEEVNKVALSLNDDKKMQSIDLIETCI